MTDDTNNILKNFIYERQNLYLFSCNNMDAYLGI